MIGISILTSTETTSINKRKCGDSHLDESLLDLVFLIKDLLNEAHQNYSVKYSNKTHAEFKKNMMIENV